MTFSTQAKALLELLSLSGGSCFARELDILLDIPLDDAAALSAEVIDSGFVWAFQVPLAYILSHFTALPILPLYTFVTVAEGLKIILGYIFVKRGKWINNLVTDL